MSALMITGLSKCFGSKVAVADVTLDVPAASRTVIIGPSGSGKSTLLRLIAGFDVPDHGQIKSDGVILADGPAAVPAHRRNIGFVTQAGGLFPHLSVARNIAFGLACDVPYRRGRIAELMALVELDSDLADRRPHELSGGQQQRVALARALARRPGNAVGRTVFGARRRASSSRSRGGRPIVAGCRDHRSPRHPRP